RVDDGCGVEGGQQRVAMTRPAAGVGQLERAETDQVRDAQPGAGYPPGRGVDTAGRVLELTERHADAVDALGRIEGEVVVERPRHRRDRAHADARVHNPGVTVRVPAQRPRRVATSDRWRAPVPSSASPVLARFTY